MCSETFLDTRLHTYIVLLCQQVHIIHLLYIHTVYCTYYTTLYMYVCYLPCNGDQGRRLVQGVQNILQLFTHASNLTKRADMFGQVTHKSSCMDLKHAVAVTTTQTRTLTQSTPVHALRKIQRKSLHSPVQHPQHPHLL